VVFCDKSKLTVAGARGAPDLAIEILSPSTLKKDQNNKFRLYEKHGVREYWVIDPIGKWICAYRLGKYRKYDEGSLRDYSPLEAKVLPGFVVRPKELFAPLD
jgi:Uma2 family endonuclease